MAKKKAVVANEERRVTLADRQRVTKLIEGEMWERIREAEERVTEQEIDTEVARLNKEIGLTPGIAKLEKLQLSISEIKHQLSDLINKYLGTKESACACTDHERAVRNMAEKNLKSAHDKANKGGLLRKKQRELLAKVEVATNIKQLEAAMREAGVL